MTPSAKAVFGGCGCVGSHPSFSRSAREVFEVGAGFAQRALRGEGCLPRDMTLGGLGMCAASAEAVCALLPRSTCGDAWLEFANKLHAYHIFASASAGAGLSGAGSLAGTIPALRCLDTWERVWTIEGIGYWFANSALRRKPSPAGFFGDRSFDALPTNVMIPLHTGAGLALAEAALGSKEGRAGARFWRECQELSAAGYAEPMFEALGLVTITMYPHLTRQIDRELSDLHPNLSAYFWHGAGRGLYFSPFGFVPVPAACRVMAEKSQRLPSSAIGRANALAGLSWAITLVNIRHPWILEGRAWEMAQWIQPGGPFLNGLKSSLIVWQNIVPEDPHVEGLQHFRPGNSASCELWGRSFAEAATDARRVSQAVCSSGQLGAMFRIQTIGTTLGS